MASELSNPYHWTNRALLLLGYIALIGMVMSHTDRFFWDEPYYFHNLDLVKQYGWGTEFLKQEWGSAGPLYTFIHYYLLPFTNAQLPQIRFVNIGLLFMVMGLSMFFISRYIQQSVWGGLLYLAIPMTYVCTGVALTEIPSFVFLILALVCLFETLYKAENLLKKYLLAILGGALMGIAVMGRQPLLVSLGAIPFLFVEKKLRSPTNYAIALLFLTTAFPLPVYVFGVWNGLLAPKEQMTAQGLAPWHMILGIGYISLTTLILAPSYFVGLDKKLIFKILGFGLIFHFFNYYFNWMNFTPMYSLLITYLPPSICYMVSFIFTSLVVVIGAYYSYSTYYRIINNISSGIFIFMTLSILLLAITSIKITHQYSSRYAFQAAPFLIFQLSNFRTDTYFSSARYLVGIAIGLGSLYSYIAY